MNNKKYSLLHRDLFHGSFAVTNLPIHPMGPIATSEQIRTANIERKKHNKPLFRENARVGEIKKFIPSDFGTGFYLTPDYDFAAIKACGGKTRDKGYVYTCDLSSINFSDYNIFEFGAPDLQWLLFISWGRGNLTRSLAPALYDEISEFSHMKDIIIGATADDRYFRYIKDFLNSMPSGFAFFLDTAVKIMRNTAYPVQVVVKKAEICSEIAVTGITKYEGEEYKKWNAKADMRAKEGNFQADKIRFDARISEQRHYSFRGLLVALQEQKMSFYDLPEIVEYNPKYEEMAFDIERSQRLRRKNTSDGDGMGQSLQDKNAPGSMTPDTPAYEGPDDNKEEESSNEIQDD